MPVRAAILATLVCPIAAGATEARSKGWSRHFPNKGAGVYRVRWQKFGNNLGPRLSFRR